MKLSEYYILKDKAERLVNDKAFKFHNKFCDKITCSDCRYEGSNDCFLDYLKDNDVEVE
jgi:hypothetical protein